MSNVEEIKRRQQNAVWPEYTRMTLEGDTFIIRRPPDSVLEEIIAAAKGVKEEEGDALAFRRKVVSACVFVEGGVRPFWTEDEVRTWPHTQAVWPACQDAINPSKALEKARGKLTGDPVYGLRVRVARIAGWTHEEAMRQPLEWVYALAADAQLENEAIREASEPSRGGGSGSSGGGKQRTIRYTMKP